MPHLPLILIVAIGVGATRLIGATNEADATPVASAPDELQHRTLANGFRYAWLPHVSEPGRVSLRLVVHAGSLDEHDDERGFAHFVEHMAFNGTTHYAPGKLVPFFAQLGLNWGADATATTSHTSTIYKIDLPAKQSSHLGEALQILRDYADGIEFEPSEVRRERGVILSELHARDSNEGQVRAQLIAVHYAGTGLPERLPVGVSEVIRQAEPAGLRRFYQRCYRPERMTLVAVGDFAPDVFARLVEQNFSSLRGKGQGAEQVLPKPLPMDGPTAHIVSSPLSQAAKVSLVVVTPNGNDTIAVEETAADVVAIGVLARRLKERQTAQHERIGRADAFLDSGIDNLYSHYGAEADAAQPNWREALNLVQSELRRMGEQGVTTDEIQEAISGLLAGMRANVASFRGQATDGVADHVASLVAAHRDWRSRSSLLAIFEKYLATFTAANASESLRILFASERVHIVLSCRSAPDGGADAVLAAYRTNAAQPLATESVAPQSELKFQYNDFGSAGAVAERTHEQKLGIELVRFANGTRLNLHPSNVQPHRFQLSARLGRGTADVPRNLPAINLLAIALMSRCDLNHQTRDELRRLTDLHAVQGSWSFDANDFLIEFTGPAEALDFTLRSLTACIADLKLEASKLADALSFYPALRASVLNSTGGYSKVETMFRLANDDSRFRIPPPEDLKQYSFETIATWMRAHWLEGSLEIGLAGDFDVERVIASAAASVGTLSERTERPDVDGEQLMFLSKPYRNVTFIDLPDKTANVRLFWPIRDASDLRAWRALQVGVAGVQTHLSDRLRQELGVTYSPGIISYRSLSQRDFGAVGVELTFEPANAQKLAERSIKLVNDFAHRGMSKAEFLQAREPLRASSSAEMRSNEWWLANVLRYAQSQPAALEEARTHETAFDDLTRDEVNRALRQLTAAQANCVGFIPQATSSQPGKR